MRIFVFLIIITLVFPQNIRGLLIDRVNLEGISFVAPAEEFLAFSRRNQFFIYDYDNINQSEVPFDILDIEATDSSIYIAGYGGVFLKTPDTLKQLPVFEPVWEIIKTPRAIFFIGNKTIYRTNDNKTVAKIPLNKNIVSADFAANKLWVNIENVGLHIISNNSPIALPYADKFQKLPFLKILKVNKQVYFFGYDNNIYSLQKNDVKRLDNATSKFLNKNEILAVDTFRNNIVILTRSNKIVFLDNELNITEELSMNEKIKNIRSAGKYLIIITDKGIKFFIPSEKALQTKLPDVGKVLNFKSLGNDLFLFGTLKTLVLDENLKVKEQIKIPNTKLTDVHIYKGQKVFSGNSGLWVRSSGWKQFLPKLPILKFNVYNDTFALKLLDTWVFAINEKGKWKPLKLPKTTENYYINSQEYFKEELPLSYDFATKTGSNYFLITDNYLMKIDKELFAELPIKVSQENGDIKITDYYFPKNSRIKIIRTKEKITVINKYSGETIYSQEIKPQETEDFTSRYFTILIIAFLLIAGVVITYKIKKKS